MRFILLIFLLCLNACGDSPLLHHTTLSQHGARVSRSLETLSFSKTGVTFMIEWSSGCPSFEACSFDLVLNEALPTGTTLEAKLWMPAMGHGSSPPEVRAMGPTLWHVSEVYFIMAGLWEVQLKLIRDGKKIDETSLSSHL